MDSLTWRLRPLGHFALTVVSCCWRGIVGACVVCVRLRGGEVGGLVIVAVESGGGWWVAGVDIIFSVRFVFGSRAGTAFYFMVPDGMRR